GPRFVGLLVIGASGDLVILDAQQRTNAALMQVGLEIFVIEVETNVAVEVAVVVIAGVALDGAPDLLGGFGVAGQDGDVGFGAEDGGVDAVLGARLGEQNAVGVGEEVANAGVAQLLIDAIDVAALRQPDAARAAAEVSLELPTADLDLG